MDTHYDLPTVTDDVTTLLEDMSIFKALADPSFHGDDMPCDL